MIHSPWITACVCIIFFINSLMLVKLYPLIYGKSLMPTGSKFFILNYVAFIYIGIFLMNILLFDRLDVAGIYSSEIKYNLLPMFMLNILCLPLFFGGAVISNMMLNYSSTNFENKLLFNDKITQNKFYKSSYFVIIVLFCTVIILYVFKLYLSNIDTLPVLGIFIDDANIGMLRSAATNDFEGKKYRFNMVLKSLPIYIFILLFLIKQKNLVLTVITACCFILCMFTAVMDGLKGPLIQLILLLIMLVIYKNKKIPFRFIAMSILGALVSLTLMYMFFMGMKDRNILDIIMAPLSRISMGSSLPLIYYLEYIPKHQYYLFGQSFPNPGGIFPFEWRRITVELMEFAHPEIVKTGVVGSMPTVFFGEFYLNFGYLGAAFSMIILGFILKTIDSTFNLLISKSNLYLPILALFFVYIDIAGTFSRASFLGLFTDINLFVLSIVSLMLIIINSIFTKQGGKDAS